MLNFKGKQRYFKAPRKKRPFLFDGRVIIMSYASPKVLRELSKKRMIRKWAKHRESFPL